MSKNQKLDKYNRAKTQYKGAGTGRNLGRWSMKKSAPDVVIKDLPTLRGRSDALYKNNSLARSAINKNLDNIIGSGMRPHPMPNHKALGISKKKAKKLGKQMLREFNFVANSQNIDAERTQNFYEIQIPAFYSMLIGGDVFALLPRIERIGTPYTTAIALISADQVCNPNGNLEKANLAGGIEVGSNGDPIYYHILKEHPNGLNYTKEWQIIKAFDDNGRRMVLHLFQKMEAGQKRGIPYLAPIIQLVKTLGDYTDSEVTAALVSSLFTVFVKSEEGAGLEMDLADEAQSQDEHVDYSMSAGSVINLKNGEDIEIADPSRPNKNYEVFYKAIVRELAVGLNLNYSILMTEFNKSFTASRAELLQVWKYFKRQRTMFTNRFAQPIFERVIEEAVLLGRINAPGFLEDPFMREAYLNCSWTGELAGAIDEIKEVKAAKARVDAGFSTREKESAMMNGSSFDENINVAEDESRKMIVSNLMDKKVKPEKVKKKKKSKKKEKIDEE